MDKNAKKGKKAGGAPPPPPPVLIRVRTPAEFEQHVTSYAGSALVAVLSSLNAAACDAILAALEDLNGKRPPALETTHLVVVLASDETRELCHTLEISALPYFESFSYGESVLKFSGDNVEKAVLIAKHAAQAATEKAQALADAAKAEPTAEAVSA